MEKNTDDMGIELLSPGHTGAKSVGDGWET